MDPRERYSGGEEALRSALLSYQAALWTTLPGIVQSFDAEKVTAQVQPAVQGLRRNQNGQLEYLTLPVCPDVPVLFPRGGGYTLTFPVKQGDECLLVFACRNIDGWWDQGGVQRPGDRRMHDLSDAFCIVGPMSQKAKIEDISTSTTQLRSDNGALKVELATDDGRITIKAPTIIRLEAPEVRVTGDLKVEGEVIGKIDGDDISLTTHVHSGVERGGGNTDDPVNGS